jgi:biopolymer transport protein TolR
MARSWQEAATSGDDGRAIHMPKVQGHENGNGNGNGSGGGRRRRSGPRVATSLSEINVVPLVDVMLVLLVIFMVTAPMMQQGMAVNLPEARRADPVSAQPIYVTVPATFRRDHRLQIGDDTISVNVLAERMRQALEGRTDRNVFVRADAQVTMQEFMQVTDLLKEAGVEKVGVLTQPPPRRR